MLSEKMKKRILILAKKYGPFVRFFPDGSEDPVVDDKPPVEKTPEEQKAIDEARANEQQLEQERANAKRANETASQAQAELESVQTEYAALQEKLEAAESKAAEAGIKDVELDESEYTGTDLALVKSIKNLNEKIDAKDKRIAASEKKISDYEAQGRKDQAKAARDSAYEELLGDLDDEYGADCRNDAVKKFNELIADGKVPKGSTAKATRVMEKCYKDVKAAKLKDTKEDKSSLPLDSGSGGGSAPNLSGAEIPDGLSLDDAVAHLAKAKT